MATEDQFTICPKIAGPCRHCSDMTRRIVTRTGDILTGIRRTVEVQHLGEFCNNDGRRFVRDIPICPVFLAILVPTAPFKPWNEVSELEWMRRRS
jgi:hypothetical protein